MSVPFPSADDYRLAPCRKACPVGTDAHAYVRALAEADFELAYEIARAPNPLASICAFICGAPCEAACRRGRLDEPVNIRALKRAALEHSSYAKGMSKEEFLALHSGGHTLRDRMVRAEAFSSEPSRPRKLAIIGSGPAGLASAHDLALLGHSVTIFEAEDTAAGMLIQGIPSYRLPREVVAQEVEFIRGLGVEIRCDTEVGRDIEFRDILNEHDGVLVAVGARRSRLLNIEGADGPGVMGGVEFLRASNFGKPVTLGKRVLVVGGGNVAYDVARSALRQFRYDVSRVAAEHESVSEVRLVCLEPRDEMPADEVEVVEGGEEGIVLADGFGPEAIERAADGSVVALRCRHVESVFDESGAFAPVYGDERERFEADTILVAIGQRFDVDFLAGVEGLELEPKTTAPTMLGENATTHEKIWVAGDLAYGPRLAIDAVASGRKAAAAMHVKLTGEELAPREKITMRVLPAYWREADYELRARRLLPVLPVEERVQRLDLVVEKTTSRLWAQHEASRCLDCGVHTIFDPDVCVLCAGCVDICPESCFRLVSTVGLELDTESPLNLGAEVTTALLKDDDICIRCGLCARRCPTDALTMQICQLESQ